MTQPPGVGLLLSLLSSPISGLCCTGGVGSAGSGVCPSPGLRFCFVLPRAFLASPSSPSWSPYRQPSSSADPLLRPRVARLPCWLAWRPPSPPWGEGALALYVPTAHLFSFLSDAWNLPCELSLLNGCPHLSHSPLGQGKHKLSLEYLVGPESQEMFPNLIN